MVQEDTILARRVLFSPDNGPSNGCMSMPKKDENVQYHPVPAEQTDT